ncbi:MAG: glycosyltransferase [Chlorobi bacterium]|nr:glycosyltransferase [Chlorobiota bacterium]
MTSELLTQIIFWISATAIIHSYLLFPIILYILSKNKQNNTRTYEISDNLPGISIILAAYNEEKYIEQKILTTLNTDYPSNKIEFIIGSDNSSDNTDKIIQKYTAQFPEIRFFRFNERKGKIRIINELTDKAENNILIMTDAKVFFKKNTLFHLVKHFKNPEIKAVGGILENNKKNPDDVSIQEHIYMRNEMIMKYREGITGKCSIGVFGAIYAIRKNNFEKVPENFKADDFYVSMKIIQKNGGVIFSEKAAANQNITGNFKEEYKRKVRIAVGNYQNLITFLPLLKKPFTKKAFYFFSHKVIRWTGPFLLLTAFVSNILLLNYDFYKLTFTLFVISLTVPIADFMLKKLNININLFRYFTHFYGMNAALATGFFKYLKGDNSGIWEPSKR